MDGQEGIVPKLKQWLQDKLSNLTVNETQLNAIMQKTDDLQKSLKEVMTLVNHLDEQIASLTTSVHRLGLGRGTLPGSSGRIPENLPYGDPTHLVTTSATDGQGHATRGIPPKVNLQPSESATTKPSSSAASASSRKKRATTRRKSTS